MSARRDRDEDEGGRYEQGSRSRGDHEGSRYRDAERGDRYRDEDEGFDGRPPPRPQRRRASVQPTQAVAPSCQDPPMLWWPPSPPAAARAGGDTLNALREQVVRLSTSPPSVQPRRRDWAVGERHALLPSWSLHLRRGALGRRARVREATTYCRTTTSWAPSRSTCALIKPPPMTMRRS